MADDPVPDDALDDQLDPLPAPDMVAIRAALQRNTFLCPSCGANRWSMPDGTNTVMAGYGPGGEAGRDFGYGFTVAAAICEGCGFVRMYHVGKLLG
jgi:hypothetical protein